MRLYRGHAAAGDPSCPSPPSGFALSCPGSGPQVPRYATSPIRPDTQPNDPLFLNATTAVDVSPGQSVGYPLCPNHDAWKPRTPAGTFGGGAMPGPTLPSHPTGGGVGDGIGVGLGAGVAVGTGMGVGAGAPCPSVVSRPVITSAVPSVSPAEATR